jgi:hypothetical protein
MTTKRESAQGKPQPLQLLVVAQGEQPHSILDKCLRANGDLSVVHRDRASTCEEATVRLAHKPYDLVLCAPDGLQPEVTGLVEELQSQGKRMPLLFLSETFAPYNRRVLRNLA